MGWVRFLCGMNIGKCITELDEEGDSGRVVTRPTRNGKVPFPVLYSPSFPPVNSGRQVRIYRGPYHPDRHQRMSLD